MLGAIFATLEKMSKCGLRFLILTVYFWTKNIVIFDSSFFRGIFGAVKMEEAIVEGISWKTAKQPKRKRKK